MALKIHNTTVSTSESSTSEGCSIRRCMSRCMCGGISNVISSSMGGGMSSDMSGDINSGTSGDISGGVTLSSKTVE